RMSSNSSRSTALFGSSPNAAHAWFTSGCRPLRCLESRRRSIKSLSCENSCHLFKRLCHLSLTEVIELLLCRDGRRSQNHGGLKVRAECLVRKRKENLNSIN